MAILSLIFMDMNDAHTSKTILGWAATLLVTKEWITNTIHHSFFTIITSRKHCRENHRNVNKLKAQSTLVFYCPLVLSPFYISYTNKRNIQCIPSKCEQNGNTLHYLSLFLNTEYPLFYVFIIVYIVLKALLKISHMLSANLHKLFLPLASSVLYFEFVYIYS